MINKISRRDFLRLAGYSLTGTVLACSGFGCSALRPPEYDETTYLFGEEDGVKKRILIGYATRAGSTADIAAGIGESLSDRDFRVEVVSLKEKPDLDGYQAVLLGSAIRMGSWLPEAVEFIEMNREQLNGLPTALFTVHMLNTGEDDASRTNRLAYLDKIRPMLNDPEEVYFEGVMDFSRLSFLDRLIAKMVNAVEADNRDWEQIRGWTPEIIQNLDQEVVNERK